MYTTVQKFGVGKIFLKDVSSAHQDCIHFYEKWSKNSNIVKFIITT